MIMESLHGPIYNSLFEDGYFGGESNLEQESRSNTISGGYCTTSYGPDNFGYEQDLENSRMSFLQILQRADSTLHPTQTLLLPETPPNLNWATEPQICIVDPQAGEMKLPESQSSGRKRKKRSRTRAAKDKEEVESQRITHIAVERNRRRQMNDHLSALRSLMPPSYVQRGDQASIVGGAINFVKELEQLLESLQDRKRMTEAAEEAEEEEEEEERGNVKVKVTVIQKHVNLKVTVATVDARRRRTTSEVVRAILGFQHLRLTVLHLNITTLQSSAHYSFSLKIEDDCHLESADEIAGAVHQIFSSVNAS